MIVMTTNENPQIALDCMNSWASGYLLMKSAEELLQAVRRVVAGGGHLITPSNEAPYPAKSVFRSFEVSASPVCDQLRSEREVGQGALSSTLSRRSALVLCQRGNVGLFGGLQGADQGFLSHGWLLSSFELARFRAIPLQEACQTRIDSTAVLEPLKNNSLAQKMEST
jgi:hypothetical protein